ncbi:uncharacterized protein LOC119462608 [Dermacentor silvarum]|uniref:uncharacterized protein LOC119462608 n=1 Tax=Dermacentor silvarum TaxID=543639 RepID=UPI00189AB490|nr:uncharacterized protein LOC119462608 [Dermacentor silvarum]
MQERRSSVFFLTYRNSGFRFLVDTGAEVSVLPASPADRKRPNTSPLQAVNNTATATYGNRSLTVSLGLQRTLRWIFILADVKFAILGADFLRHFGLLVDVRNRRLQDPVSQSDVKGKPSRHTPLSPTLIKPAGPLRCTSVLSEFSDLTHQRQVGSPVKHDVFHHITTTGPPFHALPRRLPPEKLVVARQEFDHMLKLGIIQPSSSP